MVKPHEDGRSHPRGLVPLLTTSMGLANFMLFALGALGPSLLDELDISRAGLGSFAALSYGTAAALSLYSGHLTDLLGGRRTLTLLLVTVAVAFAVLALGGAYGWLLLALLLAGVAQTFVNPATNRLIADRLPERARAQAVGVKQSGVQIGTFTAGLLLPSLAGHLGWRGALALVVPVALGAALAAVLLPVEEGVARGARSRPRAAASESAGSGTADGRRARGRLLPAAPNRPARWLIVYSLGIGTGLSSLNTYLPLYAHQRLGMGEAVAGGLLAALGASGMVARMVWARRSGRLTEIAVPLLTLAAAALGCVGLLAAADGLWVPLVWLAALGLGGTAVAANAVSMVAVVRSPAFGATGHASALVSMGFFGGFVVGPLSFGQLTDAAGYHAGWAMVATAFLGAALCALGMRRALRRAARGEGG